MEMGDHTLDRLYPPPHHETDDGCCCPCMSDVALTLYGEMGAMAVVIPVRSHMVTVERNHVDGLGVALELVQECVHRPYTAGHGHAFEERSRERCMMTWWMALAEHVHCALLISRSHSCYWMLKCG